MATRLISASEVEARSGKVLRIPGFDLRQPGTSSSIRKADHRLTQNWHKICSNDKRSIKTAAPKKWRLDLSI